ncbi:MAG: hypothetical protein PHH11_05720 [Methylomonas sp.]|nr:hypothetical protein [Methylomonas sp.]
MIARIHRRPVGGTGKLRRIMASRAQAVAGQDFCGIEAFYPTRAIEYLHAVDLFRRKGAVVSLHEIDRMAYPDARGGIARIKRIDPH